ncbi:arsenosugar biosynthesis radical SAM (seleno)protein ArsS [Synechococcus elongatus]|uniref:Fe-S oxidoreductase n=1 Tax=Synechococcus sp. (strain ATCC 27144 / PCC 6301 / SAUG 1402/1) TaxID=269084 RepID=A0A0H3K3T6_SYNP6|nr:arsenosugar biosynthesis radical SAM (seleno)protein ArsS [Synechococcus elongatus]AJD58501.1 radical SAM protein [Synechococcus elongatus UTEX 2973]MBD2587378.1 arsenosugar biosynthesis radical SAM protein ArsS [Synechococcus elongatus FACHB-242]MBD2688843.1 arsenosugar biosynthesis radical SAM protein ArsS [Synechococcus elongatus FACHB-1061]MBD2707914.1 arsenosugar biosynthesis radical SAM protein ArsS [Synechococcus elongatus PCC 7942 = FACHB-805]UOW70748.1 radical SAM/Cys-rich domain-c
MTVISSNLGASSLVPTFTDCLRSPLTKAHIHTLQINLGKRCNLACSHCHVEAGPKRTEELTEEVCQQLIQLIQKHPEIQVIDLTGGAPEMLYGFRPLVEAARQANKTVIVRSNLTIYFEPGFEDLPEYCADKQVRIVASLPCYLSDNVDKMRGHGVYDASIRALQKLTELGYGSQPQLVLDLVYNPPLPTQEKQFRLTPNQISLEQDYKTFLQEKFSIQFNHLLTITNLPIGRTGQFLKRQDLYGKYLQFLSDHFNSETVEGLMCRHQLSVDYQGQIYDCDFNQMAEVPALNQQGNPLTVANLLASDRLDLISTIQTRDYCYGCTAGSGSSCGGALL